MQYVVRDWSLGVIPIPYISPISIYVMYIQTLDNGDDNNNIYETDYNNVSGMRCIMFEPSFSQVKEQHHLDILRGYIGEGY